MAPRRQRTFLSRPGPQDDDRRSEATATTFETAHPRELFQTRVASAPFFAPTYDVTADGQRFLINTSLDETKGPPPMTMVMNWAPKK